MPLLLYQWRKQWRLYIFSTYDDPMDSDKNRQNIKKGKTIAKQTMHIDRKQNMPK